MLYEVITGFQQRSTTVDIGFAVSPADLIAAVYKRTSSTRLGRLDGSLAASDTDGTLANRVQLSWVDRSEIESGYTVARDAGGALTFDGTDDHIETVRGAGDVFSLGG